MYIYLSVLVSAFLVYWVPRIQNGKEQDSNDLGVSTYQTTKMITKKRKIYSYSFFKDLAVTSIFWIIGLSLLFGGYSHIMSAKEITNQGNKTTAVITDVRKYEVAEPEGEHSDERDVSLMYYTADGKKYNVIVKEAKIYKSVGDKIEIYYDSKDPTIIVSPEEVDNKTSLLIPLGVVQCVIALTLHIGSWIISKRNH